EDGVLGPEKGGDLRLELSVDVLRPADETDGSHSVAMGPHRLDRSLDHLRVVRKAQIIVGAEIDHVARLASRGCLRADMRTLRREDRTLLLPEAAPLDVVEDRPIVALIALEAHGWDVLHSPILRDARGRRPRALARRAGKARPPRSRAWEGRRARPKPTRCEARGIAQTPPTSATAIAARAVAAPCPASRARLSRRARTRHEWEGNL